MLSSMDVTRTDFLRIGVLSISNYFDEFLDVELRLQRIGIPGNKHLGADFDG